MHSRWRRDFGVPPTSAADRCLTGWLPMAASAGIIRLFSCPTGRDGPTQLPVPDGGKAGGAMKRAALTGLWFGLLFAVWGCEAKKDETRARTEKAEPAEQKSATATSPDDASVGQQQIQALIQALESDRPAVRASAADALGRIGAEAKAGVPVLGLALTDPNAVVQKAAADALVRIGPEARSAVPQLIRAMKDDDLLVAMEMAKALDILAPGAVPELIQTLTDKDPWVRRHAAEYLGKIGPGAKAAVPALTEAARDGDPAVRRAAADALRRIQAGPSEQTTTRDSKEE